MRNIQGYHGEWNMGSPGGWDYQRIAQLLGKMAWNLILKTIEVGVDIDFDHPQINAVPGFARMLLRAHRNRHGRNPVHAVLLAESETLDVVLENKNFVDYLNTMDGVKASLAGPGHLSLKNGKITCLGDEATVIFMDFNLNTLIDIGRKTDIVPIKEAIRQGILVNPKGMEPLGAKGMFEVMTAKFSSLLSADTRIHTPWTRQFYARSTTDPHGEPIQDLVSWTHEHWEDLVLKPAHGYSGHGIFVGYMEKSRAKHIKTALDSGNYIVQQLVPLGLWSEQSIWPLMEEHALFYKTWQDALKLEKSWRDAQLEDVVRIGEEEKQLAMSQPWQGSPALMVSDGLFSFGADLLDEEFNPG